MQAASFCNIQFYLVHFTKISAHILAMTRVPCLKETSWIIFAFSIQWRSEYQTNMVLKWLKVVWSPNGLVLEWHDNTAVNLLLYSNHQIHGPVFIGGLNTYYHLNTLQMNTRLEIQLFRCLFRSPLYYLLWSHCFNKINS